MSKTNANIDMSMNTNASILKCVTNTCTSSESTTDANVVLYFMSTNTCTFTSTDPILILGAVARSHFLWWISLWTGGDFCVGSSVESHLEAPSSYGRGRPRTARSPPTRCRGAGGAAAS